MSSRSIVVFWIILISLGSGGCVSPPEPGIVDLSGPVFNAEHQFICGSDAQCRQGPLHIVLMRRNGSVVSRSVDRPLPYITGYYVTIYAREQLYLQVQLNGDRLANLRVVPYLKSPENTLVINLHQPAYLNTAQYRGPGGMVLTIYNPFSSPLVYKAAILPADNVRPESVSTCAVMPGKNNSEVWRAPVILVWITDLHLVSNSGAIPCH
jgi:hypothetical protein